MERIQSLNVEIEAELNDARVETLANIGTSKGHISFTAHDSALRSLAKSLETYPRAWLFVYVGHEINQFYFNITSKTASEDLTDRARAALILFFRDVVNDAKPWALVQDVRDKRKLTDSINVMAGQADHVTRQGLGKEIGRQMAITRAVNETDEGNEEADDNGTGSR